jgi:hypothetical protein
MEIHIHDMANYTDYGSKKSLMTQDHYQFWIPFTTISQSWTIKGAKKYPLI